MKPPKELEHPIHALLEKRWSPRSFDQKKLTHEQVSSLFEAGKWSASAFNEQPWRFLYALKQDGDAYDKLFLGLNEKNRVWAESAPMVGFVIAKTRFTRNDKPNQHAWYDTGMAMSQLTLQATDMNLYVHQMAGIERDYLTEEYSIKAPFEIICGFVVGYFGSPEHLDGSLAEMEKSVQQRKKLSEIIHHCSWKQE